MGPKKQHKAQRSGSKSDGGSSRAAKGASQVQLSSENERKLRQLLQNTGGISGVSSSIRPEKLSEGQKKNAGKRARNIYDSLAAEGFTSSQIELALAAIPLAGLTLEAALDWLCLRLSSDELPLKFSNGVLNSGVEGGSVQVLASARVDWAPTEITSEEYRETRLIPEIAEPRFKQKEPEKVLHTEQADWIRRYVAQQEEDELVSSEESSEDSDWELFADPSEQDRRKEKRMVVDPVRRAVSLAVELETAKNTASRAKDKRCKEKQAAAGRLIRDLKKELASLGLSEDDVSKLAGKSNTRSNPELSQTVENFPPLSAAFQGNQSTKQKMAMVGGELAAKSLGTKPMVKAADAPSDDGWGSSTIRTHESGHEVEQAGVRHDANNKLTKQFSTKSITELKGFSLETHSNDSKSLPDSKGIVSELGPAGDEDVGMMNMFDDELAPDQALPPSVLELKKTEKLTMRGQEKAASGKGALSSKTRVKQTAQVCDIRDRG